MNKIHNKYFHVGLFENKKEKREEQLLKNIMKVIFLLSFVALIIIARYYAL